MATLSAPERQKELAAGDSATAYAPCMLTNLQIIHAMVQQQQRLHCSRRLEKFQCSH